MSSKVLTPTRLLNYAVVGWTVAGAQRFDIVRHSVCSMRTQCTSRNMWLRSHFISNE